MYRKELFTFNGDRPIKTVIRNYQAADIPALIDIQKQSFPPPFPSELWWNQKQLNNHISHFPEGAVCVEIDGQLVGSITSLLVNTTAECAYHTWEEITDCGYIRNHNPYGNTLYIVDICVIPKYRRLRLGQALMETMYEVVIYKRLKRLLGGGRMPGYRQHANRLTADQYLAAVVKGELYDPVITFLLHCGRTPVKVVANYLEDHDSCNYAALMEWRNPFFFNRN